MKKLIFGSAMVLVLIISAFSQYNPVGDTEINGDYGEYYERGEIVKFFDEDDVQLFFQMTYDKTYGKYYRIDISFRNLTGAPFLLNPSTFTAKYMHKKNGMQSADVLTYNEYLKKVKRKQTWAAIAIGFSEGLATSNAGYSYSTTNTSTYSTASGNSYTSGYLGSTYSNVNSYGSVSGYSNSTSVTTSYSSADAAYERQLSAQRMNDFSNNQNQIRETINEGYLRKHTMHNETELVGYINIEYNKTSKLILTVIVNGKAYQVDWSN